FALQNAPREEPGLPGLVLSALPVDNGTAKFELSLGCAESPDGLAVAVEYNQDLFDATTAERLLGQFRTLLAGLVASPGQRLSDLPVLAASERHQIVAEWNDTRRGNVEGALIHRLFEADAAAWPDAEALLSGETRITYGELNLQANRLARHLRRLGVGLETPVGIFLDSSPELIVGYLAVLKAGGAYVPLGINDPADRLAFMLEETGAPVVLTRRAFTGGLLADLVRFVEVDATESYGGESGENLDNEVPGHGLAYIIYTSGSTGRPKGVACTHEGVVRLVRESGWVDFEGETFLQITATTFDVSTFEIWGSLLNHGRLAFLTTPAPTLEELGKAIAGYGVTTLWLTSGLFGLMVDRRLEDLRPLRQLVAGGDIVPVPQARRVVEELPHIRMINGYGPTENTTFTVCHTLATGDVYRPSIPIGRPFGNSTAYVLDGDFQTTPLGTRGELCGGGLGVARGYFGRPDLTADKFIPDPFSDKPGARLYRTGDVARWLPDGTIEFFGRQDTQVKIRGFRIEPGEIETVLGRHSAVGEAVVVAREDRSGDRRLVAYIVAAPGAEPSSADLQAFLRRDLPDYMVPSAFVVMDSLPLTTAGKVNRAALPAPEDAARGSHASFVPPRTELEEKIAAVWREVLALPQVGVHDNFFDLGGHSLLLLQAVSRLGEVLGRELPKGQMFEHPTVAALARALDEQGGEEGPAPALERSQDRAAARRESIRQRRRTPVQAAGPRDPFDMDMEDEE
ncbi:MAG TPA: amino acid adenylation domain-containing protein, partial [Thermoanaerobaculia bacterium]|nr:amino acid adenylation domain-containing protein [Thermoanaerobaculia bacterium]